MSFSDVLQWHRLLWCWYSGALRSWYQEARCRVNFSNNVSNKSMVGFECCEGWKGHFLVHFSCRRKIIMYVNVVWKIETGKVIYEDVPKALERWHASGIKIPKNLYQKKDYNSYFREFKEGITGKEALVDRHFLTYLSYILCTRARSEIPDVESSKPNTAKFLHLKAQKDKRMEELRNISGYLNALLCSFNLSSLRWQSRPLRTIMGRFKYVPSLMGQKGPEPITPLNKETSIQNSKSIIEGHVSALKELLKEPSNRDLIKPMLLDFDDIQDVSDEEIEDGAKEKAKKGDEDLSKPFKEVLKCPFTRRIVEFSSPGYRLPANAKIYDGTGDPEDHTGRFIGIGNQGEWLMPEKFLNRFGMLKACYKDPTEISKIVRRANETLLCFKERWVSESNAIPNVPELMQISSFMSSRKCPELAKRFSDNVPKTVDEMLKRVDDYLWSEEAFRNMELPRGEFQRKDVTTGRSANKENVNKYCDYHNEKGRNMNDCFHLKLQLELALESDRKRKTIMTDEKWMNVHIIFPPVLARDLSEEALVVEAKVEGYLVRRIHIDEGASIEIMSEHCFNLLHPSIRSRLVETQTTISGFSGEQVKLLGKIELDVCFGGSGRCRRAILIFTIIPAPSPYNIILGHPGLKQLRAITSTIHGMMKFPTPWVVATLLSQTPVVLECRREGKKQVVKPPKERKAQDTISPTNQVLVNPTYPEQLITIGTGLSPEGSSQLKKLLKKNIDIFAWEPSDMTGLPKRIIKHSLNANPLEKPVSHKKRVFCPKKSRVINEEVAEWLKARIFKNRL
uniref:Reverse transcriptase domain-containing protein n=1 Tax=Tanacetum cinerariifolium TaxID=118510 RepID=A0A6L2NP44_TANCI|nr:reverse transcriptase domain-containing protein [Tanacetum cinerariifolium]